MNKKQSRTMEIDWTRVDDDEFPVLLSTPSPVRRGDLDEILLHNSDAVDLSRAPLPVQIGHDTALLNVGIVDGLRIAADGLRGVLKLGTSDRARELYRDIKSGILRNVSIGYEIQDYKIEGQNMLVTRWQPYEMSLVGVPADPKAGLNRSMRMSETQEKQTRSERRKENRSAAEERQRVRELLAIGDLADKQLKGAAAMARSAVENGDSVEAFRQRIYEAVIEKGKHQRSPRMDYGYMQSNGGQEYSFVRAVRALSDPRAMDDAGFEVEVSQELARQRGRSSDGLLMPVGTLQQRSVQKGGSGSNTIATEHLAAQFIDILRDESLIMRLPITVLQGLQGDIVIPRQSGSATAEWVEADDNDALTPSDPAFDQISLAPKTLGGLVTISRKMLLQGSPDTEMLVQRDLAKVIARELDRVSISGDGTNNQPTGILNIAGIGSVQAGGALADMDPLILLETSLADLNAATGGLAYATNSAVLSQLKRLKVTTGEYIWSPAKHQTGSLGSVNGYSVHVSNVIPRDLGAGSDESAVIFGNWRDFLLAHWGVLEIMSDPYGSNFAKGSISVRAMMDLDIGVRHPESFAAIKDIAPA